MESIIPIFHLILFLFTLSQTKDLAKVVLYLNFDMLASPNYVPGVLYFIALFEKFVSCSLVAHVSGFRWQLCPDASPQRNELHYELTRGVLHALWAAVPAAANGVRIRLRAVHGGWRWVAVSIVFYSIFYI
jgi:hypothetical protein